ncbi:MAG: sporulation protein YqfD, partial [Clostridia bacterium]|nr:sporulation protein YqfD [Clostridia bacterium]
IIVSGVVEEKTGVVRLVHARAKVIALTIRVLSKTVPYKSQQQRLTGKTEVRRELNIAGIVIPLSFGSEPQGQYIRSSVTSDLTLFGKKLPISVKTTTWSEYRTQQETLTGAQALSQARAELTKMESVEFAGIEVRSKRYEEKKEVNGVTVTGYYKCKENIAYEDQINIS